ncbi:MAG: 4-hydroxy-tetrahydrodipicolinate reductase, partial [Clostridia bacterium]|nr:4-hydroxy-tetrahydrodipicolinate reductase [Clostridia bacterium]
IGYAVGKKVPLVIATTGQTDEEMKKIREAAREIPVFYSANYSLGIALLTDAAKRIAAAMPDAEIEIVEKHHDRKLDAPSGTALSIARELQKVRPEAEIISGRSGYGKRTKEEIGIQSIRIGNCVGEHEVLIGTQTQTITLKHEAHDRALFAEGALAAASFLLGREPGFYGMEDLLKN